MIYAAFLLVCAAILLTMGGYLLWLGGTAYFVLAGIAMLASAILVWHQDRRAAWVYALILLGTLGWTWWEIGLDPWGLVSRFAALIVVGLPMFWTWLENGRRRLVGFGGLAVALAVLLGVALTSPVAAPEAFAATTPAASADGDWRFIGRDIGGSRFAPFTEINSSNVNKLQVAWTYRAGSQIAEATPLKIGDALYFCTSDDQVISLDAETGKQRWRYDPKLAATRPAKFCRGVAYHAEAAAPANAPCAARVFAETRDARLFALDARTGKPCEDFGVHGTVDLKANMGPDPAGYQYSSSAPMVVGDIVVVGTGIFDGQSTTEPSGVVRAFRVKDGSLAWAWDMGRPDDHGAPPPGQSYTRGTPNVWTLTSADPALGLIYLPTGNAPPDYFGAHRTPQMEKYASSLVAVNVADGSVRWSFQTTHHDIWDYDIASQPVLTDFPTPAGPVPAVIQATKRGEIFVLDRRDGRLLTRVEERKVPTDAVAGDWASPTQPFSVGMPSLAQPRMREADMWGLTPIDMMICRIMFREARYEGPMTPLGTRSTIQYPSNWGVSNWGSVSVDPGAGILIAPANNTGNYMRLIPHSSPEAAQYNVLQPSGMPQMQPENGAPQHGTPYAITNPTFMSPLMVPCNRPPYGRLYAIDLKTQKVLWVKPLGTARNSGPFGIGSGLSLPMGVPMNAGVLVTAGNLSFYGGSNDGYLRAISTRTGKELWREDLPVGSNATPMTYLAPKSGRQILLVSAGGAVGTLQKGDYMIAYRLPAGVR
jgi:quinate dehydrogenase (quinone)